VNTLVEKEHLGSNVFFWSTNHTDMMIRWWLTSVETDKLADAEQRFLEVLKEHASKPLDMSYLKDCLHRSKRQTRYMSEIGMNEYKDPIIKDHVFGDRNGTHLEDAMATLYVFDTLDTWTEEEWRAYLNKWMVDAHHVSILGKPSKALSDKIKADEIARVKAQQKKSR
jgi:Zn-dependent M16 (insulinase) family peptidase